MGRQPSLANLFIIALIIVISSQIRCIRCQSGQVVGKNFLDVSKSTFQLSDVSKSALITRLKGLTRLIGGQDRASARGMFDFMTDPSLVVTILHTLEVAYWTLPMGFLLMPIINFFRVPNRRSGRSGESQPRMGTKEELRRTLDRFYTILSKAIDKYERLVGNDKQQQVHGRPQIQLVSSITPEDK